jgi:hypothetical protein
VFSNFLPSNDSFVAIRCSGNVISQPLISNGRLLRLYHSGFQPSCHNNVDAAWKSTVDHRKSTNDIVM